METHLEPEESRKLNIYVPAIGPWESQNAVANLNKTSFNIYNMPDDVLQERDQVNEDDDDDDVDENVPLHGKCYLNS